MRARVFTLLAVTAVSAATLQAQTFRVGVDLVHFGVTVTDKQGQPITGLTEEDFEVIERGKPQRIKFFAKGDTALAPPLHLGFLLDTSGSMSADMKDVRTAAVKFLNKNEHAVDVTLVDFDTEVRVARYDGNDYPRLIERIRARKPDGWTALYDAMGVYLDGASHVEGQKMLVAYTDGGDTRSSLNAGELSDLLKASDVTMYVDRLPGEPVQQRAQQRAHGADALRGPHWRTGVLPDQRQRGRGDVRARSSAKSPPATRSATARPMNGRTGPGVRWK